MTNYTQFNVMSGNDVKQLVALEMENKPWAAAMMAPASQVAGAMGARSLYLVTPEKLET